MLHRRAAVLCLVLALCSGFGFACASPSPSAALDAGSPGAGPQVIGGVAALDSEPPELAPIDPESTYLTPNAVDRDGTEAYVHFTRDDMPLRVNVDLPRQPARYASREQTREAVIDGMRVWAEALQGPYPWFALEFVEGDPAAPVQITWKRRMGGDAAGRGGIGWWVEDGVLRVSSGLEYTTQTCLAIECHQTADEMRMLVAHEFGHVLGLGHCLDCDSIMSYAWHTEGRVLVTDYDVRTYRALNEVASGTRVDGRRLGGLPEARTGP